MCSFFAKSCSFFAKFFPFFLSFGSFYSEFCSFFAKFCSFSAKLCSFLSAFVPLRVLILEFYFFFYRVLFLFYSFVKFLSYDSFQFIEWFIGFSRELNKLWDNLYNLPVIYVNILYVNLRLVYRRNMAQAMMRRRLGGRA